MSGRIEYETDFITRAPLLQRFKHLLMSQFLGWSNTFINNAFYCLNELVVMIALWSRQWFKGSGKLRATASGKVCLRVHLSVLCGINSSLIMLLFAGCKDIFQIKWASQGKNQQFSNSQVSQPCDSFGTELYLYCFSFNIWGHQMSGNKSLKMLLCCRHNKNITQIFVLLCPEFLFTYTSELLSLLEQLKEHSMSVK